MCTKTRGHPNFQAWLGKGKDCCKDKTSRQITSTLALFFKSRTNTLVFELLNIKVNGQ